MSIAPIDTPDIPSYPRWTLPVATRPFEGGGEAAPPPPEPAPGDGGTNHHHGSNEMSLPKLIAQLSSQLKSIERTFMQALQSLARGVESAAAGAPPARGGVQEQARTANPYDGLIRRTAQRHELDPMLLTAVIHQESGFDPKAKSSAGAMGLMQLMPDTAKSLGVSDPYDPAQNVDAGAKMLRGLIDQYGGRLDLALAAYNAGSGAVDRYHGVPPYAETRNYVSSILADYRAHALG